MSELVNKIRTLSSYIVELEARVAEERARYCEEVDHSEDMALILSSLHAKSPSSMGPAISVVLSNHQARREEDENLPSLPKAADTEG